MPASFFFKYTSLFFPISDVQQFYKNNFYVVMAETLSEKKIFKECWIISSFCQKQTPEKIAIAEKNWPVFRIPSIKEQVTKFTQCQTLQWWWQINLNALLKNLTRELFLPNIPSH